MAKVGRGRGGRGEGRGNINDPDALLNRGVVWSDPLIEILLSMYSRGTKSLAFLDSQWEIIQVCPL